MPEIIKPTSVIIPCYILDEYLYNLTQKCFESIRKTSDVELIAIDNGSPYSTDGLYDDADILVKNKVNRGYVKATNQGLRLCSGAYIVCGNNDYEMSEGWEQAMQNIIDNVPDCGVSMLHVDGDLSPTTNIIGQVVVWEEALPGGWFMLPRARLYDVGVLDEMFFNNWGDSDYAFRLKKQGLACLASSEVTVKHHGQATISKLKDHDKTWKDGQALFIAKWENDPVMGKYLKQKLYGKS